MSVKRLRVCALPECDVEIVRRNSETAQNFNNRKYCCREHAAKHSNRKRRERRKRRLMI